MRFAYDESPGVAANGATGIFELVGPPAGDFSCAVINDHRSRGS